MIIQRQHFERIDSTHLYLMREGAKLDEGTIITADFQEEGRGRLGRTWTASPGSSLLASLLLKPDISAVQAPQLTHVMTLACARALSKDGVDINIRWPNDLICRDKKIAGILAEARLDGDEAEFVVLSCGINLNQTREELEAIDRPATSCLLETGRSWSADAALTSIVKELETLYTAFLKAGFQSLKKEWESLNYLRGTAITLDLGSSTVEGTVEDIDDDGRLVLATEDGTRTFSAGEIVRVSGETL